MDIMNEHLIEISGTKVTEDENGNICLNDLWALAGSDKNLRARDWFRYQGTKALLEALAERIVGDTHTSLKKAKDSVFYTVGRGRASKTYAHPVLALAYAEHIDPAIGIEVRETFLRYRANDISLANDILDRIAEQVKEDERRVHIREEIAEGNTDLQAAGKRARCQGWQYAELHNSGYRGLYNGLDMKGIHRLKELTKSQHILDHMSAAEGAANLFRITQANVQMAIEDPKTPAEAFEIAENAGKETRAAIERISGVMPEDMKSVDGINKAKKRLEANKPLLSKKDVT